LLVAGLFWMKSTAGWWLISRANRLHTEVNMSSGWIETPTCAELNSSQNGFYSIRQRQRNRNLTDTHQSSHTRVIAEIQARPCVDTKLAEAHNTASRKPRHAEPATLGTWPGSSQPAPAYMHG
jgi:hypothetical protein